MPETLTMIVAEADATDTASDRIRWTRKDCARLIRSGILEGENYELIEGDVVRKVKNRPHVIALLRLLNWLSFVFGNQHLQSENPIDVAASDNRHNALEPDAVVTVQPAADYTNAAPGPADLRLVVEVADTTLRRDTTTKARLYARAGIADYWVLDVLSSRAKEKRYSAFG